MGTAFNVNQYTPQTVPGQAEKQTIAARLTIGVG